MYFWTHISLLSLSFLLVRWMIRTRNQKPVEKKGKESQRKGKVKEIQSASNKNRNQTPIQGNSPVTPQKRKHLTPLHYSKRRKFEISEHDKNHGAGAINGRYNIRLLLPPLTEEESYDDRCWRINYAKKILKQFEETNPAPRLIEILYQDFTRSNREEFVFTNVDVAQLKVSH